MSVQASTAGLLFDLQQAANRINQEISKFQRSLESEERSFDASDKKPSAQQKIGEKRTVIGRLIDEQKGFLLENTERQNQVIQNQTQLFTIQETIKSQIQEITQPGEGPQQPIIIEIPDFIEQISLEPIIEAIPEEIKKINPLILAGGAIVAILLLK